MLFNAIILLDAKFTNANNLEQWYWFSENAEVPLHTIYVYKNFPLEALGIVH